MLVWQTQAVLQLSAADLPVLKLATEYIVSQFAATKKMQSPSYDYVTFN